MDDISGELSLPAGVTLLSGSRESPALHTLVAATHETGTRSLWVDGGNEASTYVLYDVSPHRRALSGLSVARAFTAYQHRTLVERCRRRIEAFSADGEALSLVVAPSVDRLYADADVPGRDGEKLLSASLSDLRALAREHDVPVLVTAVTGTFAEAVAEVATQQVEATHTRFGLRFSGAGIETDCYRCAGGWQTTIPYWVDLLGVADESALATADAGAQLDLLAATDG